MISIHSHQLAALLIYHIHHHHICHLLEQVTWLVSSRSEVQAHVCLPVLCAAWRVLLQRSIILRLFFIVKCGIAHFLCAMHVFVVWASSSSRRLPLCLFIFFLGLHCRAHPWREIAYSVTQFIWCFGNRSTLENNNYVRCLSIDLAMFLMWLTMRCYWRNLCPGDEHTYLGCRFYWIAINSILNGVKTSVSFITRGIIRGSVIGPTFYYCNELSQGFVQCLCVE